ncbi:MAG TPA: hypothetical protein H9824_01890 [Candidatus Bacteroides pullicola]|uniref:Uncharacterized protein n=1 Tax=Candidatus Bacteroides pullicola TaxID=2838475 RepID=A0A9D1ZFY9_9BACE|nr:hypothetical protein [Candidatus Bacteroides pullicola]
MKRLQLYRALACGLAFVATAGLSAQTPQEMAAYFAQRIGQPSVFTPAQGASLSPDALAPARDRVWTAWQEANARLDEPKLPPLLPLTADTKGALALPDSLEPAATMDYYWGSKGGQPAAGWPVYIYLHGSGPREREWSNGLKFATLFEDAPSAYFVPRIPNEGGYYRWWQRSKQWAWSWLLRQLMLDDRLDARKIYVFGISEGGYGSQRLASFYADYWAAAGPMAGGEPLKNAPAENCRNIGFSLLTGADDTGFYRNELTGLVQAAFDSLQALHPDAYRHRVELLPGQGHNFDYRPTTPWLRAFERNPWPRKFSWEDFEMDGWHRTGFYNLVVNRRPGDLRTRYDVEIAGNRIDLSISEVHYQTVRTDPKWGIELEFARTYTPATGGELTLYLDEHLVDLRQEVSVYVNGKQVYRGRVACSVGSMMESLATFYDRERIYPASILIKY